MSSVASETSASTTPRWLLWFAAALVPLLLLGLLEAGLRIADVAAPQPLFITDPRHPDYKLPNPQVVLRYFGDPETAPAIQIETTFFEATKDASSFRVVVQGGSTAAGFPYGLGASLAGMLDQRLQRAYPSRKVEVINTAMSAVNSYALLDFVDEIIAEQPDLVVVYAGHNEYLGLFGVGSAVQSGC